MGTCYSSNTVRKSNKKSSSCFGSICNDSQGLQTQNKIPPERVNVPKIESSYNIYHKKDKLNKEVNDLIEKYKEKLGIKKINFIQIYNIFMNYIYDFTKCNFIICDTREEVKEKTQIFLKKFHQINYTIRQVETMDKDKENKFCNYLNNKKIMFILKDDSSLDILEKFIIYFIANNYDGKNILKEIYILAEYIQAYNDENASNTYLEYLNCFIDEDVIYTYSPKILINCQDIKSSSLNYTNPNINNAYIFVNSYPHIFNTDNNKDDKILNKFDINYICNKNTEETDIFLKFISRFKINYILNFILSNEDNNNQKKGKYITHSEAKRIKINNEEKKSLMKQKNVNIPKDIQFEDYYKNIKNEFISIIEEFKNQVVENNCVLIQFDDNIDTLFKYKLIYVIIYRITGLSFDDIFNYLKSNFFDIENESFTLSKKDEFLNLFV